MERLAVDIGGTFVDAIRYDGDSEQLVVEKSDSTSGDPADGVVEAIEKTNTDLSRGDSFVHGTTLGLNALLERDGVKTGLITNEGFIDVLELGRYDRPYEEMFNLLYEKPEPLVPRHLRKGVSGRVDGTGDVIDPIDRDDVIDVASNLVEQHDVDSIAVCLLHSYANPEQERRISEIVNRRYPEVSLSLSSDISGEYREYERTSTTVLDAYIKPIFESYVDELDEWLATEGFDGSFFITRSGGGSLAANSVKETPIHSILSGPAGGIIGATNVAQLAGYDRLIAADMGGTSVDTCVITNGTPVIEHEAEIEDHSLQIPVYDLRTIGSGGGSVAWLDGEFLKVGPESAGADPGPICYGRGGTEPTVTDAAVVLGYIDPEAFLGGTMDLAVDEARDGIRRRLAEPLGTTPREISQGVFDVLAGDIVNAINEITVERGLDPRDFRLLSYGGAGPMAMPLVGRELDVASILIPRAPSVFSAWGMLLSNVNYDFSQTTITRLEHTNLREIESSFEDLERQASSKLRSDGFGRADQSIERSVEMRYMGQEHTVEVPADGVASLEELEARFNTQYGKRYDHRMEDPIEVVHLRVRGVGHTDNAAIARTDDIDTHRRSENTYDRTREAYCFAEEEFLEFDVRPRVSLSSSASVSGPAIVQEPTTTIVVHSDQVAALDDHGNIEITAKGDPE